MTTIAEKMLAIRAAADEQDRPANSENQGSNILQFPPSGNELSLAPRILQTGLFSSKPTERKFAILLIDASYDFAIDVKDSTHELEQMTEVLKAARTNGVPVYEFEVPGEFKTHPKLKAQKGEKWESFFKAADDPFEDTPIRRRLKREGITDVILMGSYHDRCVLAAAISAHRAGFHIITSPMVTQGKASLELHDYYAQHGTVVPDGKDLIDMLSGKTSAPSKARKTSADSATPPWTAPSET